MRHTPVRLSLPVELVPAFGCRGFSLLPGCLLWVQDRETDKLPAMEDADVAHLPAGNDPLINPTQWKSVSRRNFDSAAGL